MWTVPAPLPVAALVARLGLNGVVAVLCPSPPTLFVHRLVASSLRAPFSVEAGARGICAGLRVPGSPHKHTCAVTRGVDLPDAQPTTSARAREALTRSPAIARAASTAECGRRPHRRAPSPGEPPFSSCSFRGGPSASLDDSASHVGQRQCCSVAPYEGTSLALRACCPTHLKREAAQRNIYGRRAHLIADAVSRRGAV